MFEVAAQHGADFDVFAQPLDPGSDGADAAHEHLALHACAAGQVERVDDRFVDDGVDLDAHASGFAGASVFGFAVDQVQQAGAH